MACIAMANACVAAATSTILLPKSVKLSLFPLPSAHVCGVGFFPVMRPCSTSPRRSAALQLQAVKKGGVEPDLCEDYVDIWATPGEGQEDLFPWGKADGAHSWHEGDDGTFIEGIREVLDSAGGPTGFQAVISWLFLPGFFTGLAFEVQPTYLYLYTALFIFAFIGIEMDKPAKESEFEPERYRVDK